MRPSAVAASAALACVLWAGVAEAQGKGDAAKGETLFKQRCSACHSIATPPPPGPAPNLRGVVGRKAGAANFKYSKALPASGLTWTAQNLDKFLAAPATVIPGTFMVIAVPKPDERRDLIAYLATVK
jgi:cytochrome c